RPDLIEHDGEGDHEAPQHRQLHVGQEQGGGGREVEGRAALVGAVPPLDEGAREQDEEVLREPPGNHGANDEGDEGADQAGAELVEVLPEGHRPVVEGLGGHERVPPASSMGGASGGGASGDAVRSSSPEAGGSRESSSWSRSSGSAPAASGPSAGYSCPSSISMVSS